MDQTSTKVVVIGDPLVHTRCPLHPSGQAALLDGRLGHQTIRIEALCAQAFDAIRFQSPYQVQRFLSACGPVDGIVSHRPAKPPLPLFIPLVAKC
jgi:hypothetical protein